MCGRWGGGGTIAGFGAAVPLILQTVAPLYAAVSNKSLRRALGFPKGVNDQGATDKGFGNAVQCLDMT